MSKRERCKDLVGCEVMLTAQVETIGGDVFPVGTRMRIRQTHRGKYTLHTTTGAGAIGAIGISRRKFDLIRPMTDVEIAERDRAIADFPGGLVLSPEEADELRSNTVRVRE